MTLKYEYRMLIEEKEPYKLQYKSSNDIWTIIGEIQNDMPENEAFLKFHDKLSFYHDSFKLGKTIVSKQKELIKYKITRYASRYTLYAWDESIKQWIDLGGKVFANDKQAIDYYSGFGNRLLRSKTIHEFFA